MFDPDLLFHCQASCALIAVLHLREPSGLALYLLGTQCPNHHVLFCGKFGHVQTFHQEHLVFRLS